MHTELSGQDRSSQPSTVQYPPGWEMSQVRSDSVLQSMLVSHPSPISRLQAAAAIAPSNMASAFTEGF